MELPMRLTSASDARRLRRVDLQAAVRWRVTALHRSASFLGRMRMGAAYGRRHDFSGDVKVPDRSAAACGELGHLLRQIIQILEGHSLEPESARDAREIAVAEYRSVLGHPFRAELVQLGAVRAVVHHDDQDVQPMALDGLELL